MSKGKWEAAYTKPREGESDDEGAPFEEDGDDMVFVDHDPSQRRHPGVVSGEEQPSVGRGGLEGGDEDFLHESAEDARLLDDEASSAEGPAGQAWKEVFLGVAGAPRGRSTAPTLPADGPRLQLSVGQLSVSEGLDHTPPSLAKMNPSLNSIWTSLLMKSAPTPRTLLFCGATQGEGASFISFHFSLFLALGLQLRVLYLDTDVEKRSPSPHLPPVQGGRGLVSFFDEGLPLESLVAGTQFDNLWVLPAGDRKSSSQPQGFVYGKETLGKLVSFCRRHFDVAIFDGQPVLWSPATVAFGRAVDRVIMVCRYGYSRREVSKLAIDTLGENEVQVAGVILNDRQYPVPQKLYKKLK